MSANKFTDGLVADWCSSFERVMCSKGDDSWALVRTDEFRKAAVRIALKSGFSRQQVADDLGVCKSALNGLTPDEYICKIWTSEPKQFILNPIQQMPGRNI